MALLFVIVVTSINCVQNTTTPQPTLAPGATPTPEPMPTGSLTWDQQESIKSIAINDPYIKDLIPKMPGRIVKQTDTGYDYTNDFIWGEVKYMSFQEQGPDFERSRILPAAEIFPGNLSLAGVNVIAFVDPDKKRLAYVGFVPRPGVIPTQGVTYSSVSTGVEEHNTSWDFYKYYNNVTIVDTGYIKI